jgi:WD40 repeat protein
MSMSNHERHQHHRHSPIKINPCNLNPRIFNSVIMASSRASGAFKFQEFAAHSSAVRCAAIGRKSNQVIATGGEDRKVNVWAVGKPQPVLRLTGHTSSVECVAFDAEEEVHIILLDTCHIA